MFSDRQPHNSFIYYLPDPPGSIMTGFQTSAIAILIINQEILSNQCQQLKNTINELHIELKLISEQAHLIEQIRRQTQGHFIKNGQTPRKTFAKDKKCPYQTCNRKYSSRIALNAHLRKAHGRSHPRSSMPA